MATTLGIVSAAFLQSPSASFCCLLTVDEERQESFGASGKIDCLRFILFLFKFSGLYFCAVFQIFNRLKSCGKNEPFVMEWFLLCTRPGDSFIFISCQIASSSRSFKVLLWIVLPHNTFSHSLIYIRSHAPLSFLWDDETPALSGS